MKNLSKKQATDLLVWFRLNGKSNWGGWSNYPSLHVSASYLQYDTNACQVNLSESILVNGEEFNCITNGRAVGSKWTNVISFNSLKDIFEITESEIDLIIADMARFERIKFAEWQLQAQKRFLEEKDEYTPFIAPIEKIFIKSEIQGDKFIAPIGNIIFGNAGFFGSTLPSHLNFEEDVEWMQVRTQGKNGPNKKKVFAPIEIPETVKIAIEKHLSELKLQRIESLKNQVAKYESELSELKTL